MRRLIVFIAAAFLLGCAASGPQYSEHSASKASAGVIYVYRPTRAVNCCVAPAVYVDGVKRGELKNGGYLVYDLAAGKHSVQVGDGGYGFDPQTQDVVIEPGGSYYLKWVIGKLEAVDFRSYSADYNYHLIPVPVERAKSEISGLKLSDA